MFVVDLEFTFNGRYYRPIVFMNDFWNMQRDYHPLNDTIKELDLKLTFQPISFFKWQLYVAQTLRNRWTTSVFGKLITNTVTSLYRAPIFSSTYDRASPPFLVNCFGLIHHVKFFAISSRGILFSDIRCLTALLATSK